MQEKKINEYIVALEGSSSFTESALLRCACHNLYKFYRHMWE